MGMIKEIIKSKALQKIILGQLKSIYKNISAKGLYKLYLDDKNLKLYLFFDDKIDKKDLEKIKKYIEDEYYDDFNVKILKEVPKEIEENPEGDVIVIEPKEI